MHELKCYMKGHRLPLVMLLAAMSYTLSVIGGSTILPLPPVFRSVVPPVTVDSALALMLLLVFSLPLPCRRGKTSPRNRGG